MTIEADVQKTVRRRASGRRTFKWTDANITEAEKMWAEGYSSSVIGLRFGISRSSVTAMAHNHRDRFPSRLSTITDRLNPPKQGPRLSISADWLKTASTMWAKGETANRIAKVTGVRSGTAYNRIRMRPDLFPASREDAVVISASLEMKTDIGSRKWIRRVPYMTIAGAVVSLPHVSILNGKEA